MHIQENNTFKYNFNNNRDIMELTVVLEKQEEGGYTIYVPSLSGCVSQGETKEEALKNIKEAIELYLETDINETIEYAGEQIRVTV